MTSLLTVCYMAAKANEPHVERAAARAWLIEQAKASGRPELAVSRRSAALLGRPGAINRLMMSIVGLRGVAAGLGAGD